MPPVDPVARVLLELISRQHITRSAVGARARTALEPLFHTGALKEERSGAGWRICAVNPEAVERFAGAIYPQGLEVAARELDRAGAVAVLRNAKRGVNRSGEPVLIRGFSDAVLESLSGKVDVRGQTSLCGSAVFVLADAPEWRYTGNRVALVENLEPFLRFEECFLDFDAAIYCAGRMSERFLQWLGCQSFEVVHFGDYDPVGLQEYLRLKKRYGRKASLFVPDNLREMVRRYGKFDLMRDSSGVLASLRKEKEESVAYVLQCLEEFGVGLEQEILWAHLEGE